jgi:hypothetical protein
MHWKIFYGDGSTFSSEDGTPQRAPCLNVQVIIQEDEHLIWVSQTKADYYVWDDIGGVLGPRWRGVDKFGLWEYLFLVPGYKIVKAGRTLLSIDYDKIWKAAVEDPNFGRKATFARHEKELKEAARKAH